MKRLIAWLIDLLFPELLRFMRSKKVARQQVREPFAEGIVQRSSEHALVMRNSDGYVNVRISRDAVWQSKPERGLRRGDRIELTGSWDGAVFIAETVLTNPVRFIGEFVRHGDGEIWLRTSSGRARVRIDPQRFHIDALIGKHVAVLTTVRKDELDLVEVWA